MAIEEPQSANNPPNPQVPTDTETVVPITDVETSAATVNPTTDPQVTVPSPIEYVAADPPTVGPTIVAQVNTIVTDVPVSDIGINPAAVPIEQQGDYLIDVNTGEAMGIDPETGFVQNGDQLYISPGEIPVERQGDVLVDANTGEAYPIDADTGFVSVNGVYTAPEEIPVERQGDVLVDANTGEAYPIDADTGFVSVNGVYTAPEDLAPGNDPQVPEGGLVEFTQNGEVVRSPAEIAAINQQATLQNARNQAALQAQRQQANLGDWRVRLRLAPGAQYLYKDPQVGPVLQPLVQTDGVIFPYTPQITTAYRANYSSYDLTHSNYRGWFYQGSFVDDIQIQATFTAQDTAEANYLLAVITFFKSATKMFYGQDAQRGAPPPLVFLQGLGQYQFNLNPCVIAQFNYNLPADVDYIRAQATTINGTNMLYRRNQQSVATNPFTSAASRILSVLNAQGVKKGAVPAPPAPPTLGTNSPTYVPTKIDITLILHPVQSREQVSKQFSLKSFANGDLIKGGFW